MYAPLMRIHAAAGGHFEKAEGATVIIWSLVFAEVFACPSMGRALQEGASDIILMRSDGLTIEGSHTPNGPQYAVRRDLVFEAGINDRSLRVVRKPAIAWLNQPFNHLLMVFDVCSIPSHGRDLS